MDKRGFTLIEVLVVMGIISVLAAIVIVAINPAKQFAQARNTKRESDVQTILNAIGQRMVDNKGIFAGKFTVAGEDYTCGELPNSKKDITDKMATSETTETGDLGCLVPTYVALLPFDPAGASSNSYTVELLESGRVEVCAPEGAKEKSIPDPRQICVVR